jgi:fatty acid amide hydrolase
MKNLPSTLGLSARSTKVCTSNGEIVQCFINSGMIPFVRTNVPQFLMTFDCNNFLWGRSLNIWNRLRSVGGSSGGEAGLLAARCTPIGIGSDIGGSLRIPS